MTKPAEVLYECIESFAATVDEHGTIVSVRRGELKRGDDPILERREQFFRKTDMVRPNIEAAPAVAGEKRG
jgi:hypothetical protein